MDKLFFETQKKEELKAEDLSAGGASVILLALSLLCVSLLFFNLSFSLKQTETESLGKIESTLQTLADSLEENEAVCTFLGIEYEVPNEDEIY